MTEIIYGIRWEADRLVVDFSTILGFQNAPLTVTECEEDRRMVLTASQCRGAVGFYHELFAVLLQGVSVKIEEAEVQLKVPERWVKKVEHVAGSGTDISQHESHHLYRVSSTQDDRKWFVDITNAQFGIHKAFCDAKEYMKKRGIRIHTVAPLGTAKKQYLEYEKEEGYYVAASAMAMRQCYGKANAVKTAVCSWYAQKNFGIPELRIYGVDGFEELRSIVAQSVHAFAAQYDCAAERAKIPPVQHPKEYKAQLKAFRLKQQRYMLKYRV